MASLGGSQPVRAGDRRNSRTHCSGRHLPGQLHAAPARADARAAAGTVPAHGARQLDLEARTIEYGAGGGIVWDSTSQAEYEECLLKARIVTDAPPGFSMLETLLWEPGKGYFLLEEHIERLADSSHYLGARADIAAVRERLAALARSFGSQPQRVRLVVDRDGTIACESAALDTSTQPLRMAIAAAPVDPANPFLYNKTTHRVMYDQARAARPDCDDVVLWNTGGEVTEQRISLDDLHRATRIWVVNSVRKWREADLVE